MASGGKEKDVKEFYNCVHMPLFSGNDDAKALDICSTPSLYVFLGLMNCAYDIIAKGYPSAAESWAKVANSTRHAQFGFAGRHCRALLSKRNILHEVGQYLDSVVEK